MIIGASGGCGVAGTHLCKAMGVGRIVGICSSRNADFVKGLGATEIVLYDNDDDLKLFLESNKEKFDCVFNAATNGGGDDYWKVSIDLLKKEDVTSGVQSGEYVSLGGPVGKLLQSFIGTQKKHETIILMKPNSADLNTVMPLMNKIKEKPRTSIIPFSKEGLTDAIQQFKDRKTKGRIVFDMR